MMSVFLRDRNNRGRYDGERFETSISVMSVNLVVAAIRFLHGLGVSLGHEVFFWVYVASSVSGVRANT